MSKIGVFVSFDMRHDRELYELLLAQSRTASTSFAVSGCSESLSAGEVWCERARRRISEADQMIVICGKHTNASTSVTAELRIAKEEGIPHFLLWGRRDIMCTKPVGAKPAEGMYSWTPWILHDQISLIVRRASADAKGETARAALRK